MNGDISLLYLILSCLRRIEIKLYRPETTETEAAAEVEAQLKRYIPHERE